MADSSKQHLLDFEPKKPAAQYVRMSCEHQQYSTANQEDAIRSYAEKRGYRIVRTVSDEGRSGLDFTGRPGLQSLIAEVESGEVAFEAILVYDVSRWGRFQDADESAYYEYLCRRAGISVHYCGEEFENDGGPTATIIKSVKRAMAAEYSRELSSKVFQGKCRLIELGYRQGGTAGYGLRRMLVDQSGVPKGELRPGEWKSIHTDRVVLTRGPGEEVRIIRRIYELFVHDRSSINGIVNRLNDEGVRAENGRLWTREIVHGVLSNEKYIGNNVYNRHSFKLKTRAVRNSPEMWVRRDGAFPALVDQELFEAAQAILNETPPEWTDEELIGRLRELAVLHGRLSGDLIDEDQAAPHHQVYIRRFGSLRAAYRLAGYKPRQRYDYLATNERLLDLAAEQLESLAQRLRAAGASVQVGNTEGVVLVNEQLRLGLFVARQRSTRDGSPRWVVHPQVIPPADITIIVRMNVSNDSPQDYFLLTPGHRDEAVLAASDTTAGALEPFRYSGLDALANVTQRRLVEVMA